MNSITELLSDDDWCEAFPMLQQLRPDLTLEGLLELRASLINDGYKLFGMRDSGGELVCVAGVVLRPHLLRGRDFWVQDLVTRDSVRSKGFGLEMLRYLETYARGLGCHRLSLHTQLKREGAQRFYEQRAGYRKYAFVYNVDLDPKERD